MKEQSPYEGQLDVLNGRICLGQITNVDSISRTVRVRTLGAAFFGTDDLDLPNVKIMHMSWHPDGDYAISIPRIGTYGIVGFLNSEPILLGSYPISNTVNAGGRDNQENLLPGDYAFVTVAGNRIIIRSGGTVEIESTKECRTYWLPTQETIATVCQNYELDTAGGFAHWNVDPDSGDTLLHVKAYTNNEVTNAVELQVGTTDSGAILDFAVGPVDQDLNLSAKKISVQIQADGSTLVNIGPGKVTLSMAADGKVTLTTAGDTSLKVTGKVDINASGEVAITAGGDCKVKAGGNVDVKGSKIMLNGSASGVTTANSHMNVIDLITGAPVQPSTTVFADV